MNKNGQQNKNRKVIIITYYWPPSGGSPVLRWLKFVKYLHEFNWDATIYTPKNPEPQAIDETLLKEVPENVTLLKKKIREPYFLFKKLLGKPKGKSLATAFISDNNKKSWLNELSVWIRGNFFIPDARKFWIKPSVRYLTKYLNENPHDVIVSTGPPHSMHLIAQKVKNKIGIAWLADFRDPWTRIDYYNQLKLTRFADLKHRQLEQKVLSEADVIITVSPTMSSEFQSVTDTPVHTITNGFDFLPELNPEDIPSDNFTLMHAGSMPESRNPEILWKVLADMVTDIPELERKLKIELIGRVDHAIIRSIKNHGLEKKLKTIEHLPNEEVIRQMSRASVLLLVINRTENAPGILTSKIFEYFSAKRPVLAFGPVDGDAGKLVRTVNAGEILDYNDLEGTRKYLTESFNNFLKGKLSVDTRNIVTYSRKNLTASLARLLNELVP